MLTANAELRAITRPGSTPADRRLVFALIALVLVGALLHACASWMPLFPLDDAYLVQHNVRVVYLGTDTNFADTPVLNSATSFLHLVLVTLFAAFMPTAWAAFCVAWGAILLLVLGCCRVAALAALPWPLTLAMIVTALLGGDAAYQLLNGIETGLAMAAVLWGLAAYLAPAPAHVWTFPVMMGLLPLVRPELGLLGGLLIAERSRQAAPGSRLRNLLRDGAIALGVVAPVVLCYWLTTGSPIPQTVAVKQHFFADGCFPIAAKLPHFARALLGFTGRLGAVSIGLPLLCFTRVRWPVVLFVAGFCGAYVIALPGAAYHNDYRYLYLLLPFCVAGFCLAWRRAAGRLRQACAALLVVAAASACLGSPRTIRLYERDLILTARQLVPLAEFVRTHIPATEPILIHDAGFISDTVPNPLVDIVGLKDVRAAALHRDITWQRCGERGRVIDQLARERHTRYFVVFSVWDRGFHLTQDLRALGWMLEPLRPPDVAYQVYRLTPPGGEGAS